MTCALCPSAALPLFGLCAECRAAFLRDLRDLLTIELKQRRAKMTPEERASFSARQPYQLPRKRGAR